MGQRTPEAAVPENLSFCSKIFGKERWRSLAKYRMLKTFQVLCGIYICLATFSRIGTFVKMGGLVDPETGFIIDPNSEENTELCVILVKGDLRAIVAKANFQMVALAISRLSAFTIYPGT